MTDKSMEQTKQELSPQEQTKEQSKRFEERSLESAKNSNSELLVPAGLLKPEPVIPLDTIAALLESDPKAVIKLLENRDARLAELHDKKVANATQQEAHRHKENLARETTNRLSLGLIFATIASVLVYAGVSADKAAFDKILTASLAAFGGAGAAVTFSDKIKAPRTATSPSEKDD
jgi:Pyruvate/2-oxoacid:ferredoxin oxidoreductase gamma subunit